ncbi:hypothetical protein ON010_g17421 [Phytophthora cinnamomi]|nr:hypothetical protein ON010_g17421 [Phytophthora cinnamomi]
MSTHSGASGGSAAARKKTPCSFFAAGKCRNGSSCKFFHAPHEDGRHEPRVRGRRGAQGWRRGGRGPARRRVLGRLRGGPDDAGWRRRGGRGGRAGRQQEARHNGDAARASASGPASLRQHCPDDGERPAGHGCGGGGVNGGPHALGTSSHAPRVAASTRQRAEEEGERGRGGTDQLDRIDRRSEAFDSTPGFRFC